MFLLGALLFIFHIWIFNPREVDSFYTVRHALPAFPMWMASGEASPCPTAQCHHVCESGTLHTWRSISGLSLLIHESSSVPCVTSHRFNYDGSVSSLVSGNGSPPALFFNVDLAVGLEFLLELH